MRSRIAVAGITVFVALASPAHAVTVVTSDGEIAQPFQTWADRSLVPTPPGAVVVIRERCRDGRHSYCASATEPVIWLAPGRVPESTFLHELGHVFDQQVLTDAHRAQFLAQNWMAHRPWRADEDSPQEQFAEAYSVCARVRRYDGMVGVSFGYRLGKKRHRRNCDLIRRAAREASL